MKYIIILILAFNIYYVNSYSQVDVEDSLSLVSLFDSAGGVNWDNNTNWLTGNVNTWYGITVENNRVTNISLGYNSLLGSIPTSIGNLVSFFLSPI